MLVRLPLIWKALNLQSMCCLCSEDEKASQEDAFTLHLVSTAILNSRNWKFQSRGMAGKELKYKSPEKE